MASAVVMKSLAIFGPILALFVLGAAMAVRSGVVDLSKRAGMVRAAENAGELLLVLAGCVIGLVVLQSFVGFHLSLVW